MWLESRHVFAVGKAVWYHNGTRWNEYQTGSSARLHAVWGAAADNVFAIGDNGTLLRFDGWGWSTLMQPDASLPDAWEMWFDGEDTFCVAATGLWLVENGVWTRIATGSFSFTEVGGGVLSEVVSTAGKVFFRVHAAPTRATIRAQ